MGSQITKLVLVSLEEWKRLNKNGGGDTYTTIEIPSSKPRNQEGRGKKKKKKNEILLLPPPPPPIPHHPTTTPTAPTLPLLLLLPSGGRRGKRKGRGMGREGGRKGRRGIVIIGNVGNRPPGKRVLMKKKKNMNTSNTQHKWIHL